MTHRFIFGLILITSFQSLQAQVNVEFTPEQSNDYKYYFQLGWGTQKFASRFGTNFGSNAFGVQSGSHHAYFDLGISSDRFFETPAIIFDWNPYPSDVVIFFLGLGYGFQYKLGRLILQANAGFRYGYVRFTDGDLVDAIGESGLIRYDNYNNQVGPTVENGYGNAFSIDVGGRLGVRITDWFEINGGFGVSPIKFSTANSLFGRYWGEFPHENPYWVRIKAARADIGLKFLFGMNR